MARQAKRRLSLLYSVLMGFLVSLFSGGAHAQTGFRAGAPAQTSAVNRSNIRTGRQDAPAPTSANRAAASSLANNQFEDPAERAEFEAWANKGNIQKKDANALNLFRTERDAMDVLDHVQQMKQELSGRAQ